ncbi:MAG: hypothetical protein FJ125_05390, partial [Deltaproteobacteria bacterium]|nr:hypothetical protein [Deltaproteobacteria bacterium]
MARRSCSTRFPFSSFLARRAVPSLLPLLLLGLAAASARADTPVADGVNVDTTWTKAESPYLLTNDVVVQQGATLTIEPGVEVRGSNAANGDVELIVRGALVAEGRDDAPIVFRGAGGDVAGYWEGITIEANASARLRQVVIRHADYALDITTPANDRLTIDGVTATHFRTHAVYLHNGGSLTLAHLDLDGAGTPTAVGVFTSGTTVTVSGSYIRNVADGVYADNAALTLDHTIVARATDGVDIRLSASPSRSLVVRYCTFHGNSNAVRSERTTSDYNLNVSLVRSIFGANGSILYDGATRDYRLTTFSSFNENVWWGPRIQSGTYYGPLPANASTSLRYNALLVDPDNGNFAPTDRSPARYWAPADPMQTAGALPFSGTATGEGLHGFWYVHHTLAANSRNPVAGDVVVTRGAKLTLLPGATMLFEASDLMSGGLDEQKIELRVEGELEADGILANPVRFTSAKAAPAPGDWYGILILAQTEAFNISEVDLGYAYRGVTLQSNDHVVAAAHIHHCSEAAVYVDGGTPRIEDVELEQNANGILLRNGTTTIVLSAHVHHNAGKGLDAHNSAFGLEDSFVHDNDVGVNMQLTGSPSRTVRLTHCTVAHNKSDGLRYQRTMSDYSLTVNLISSSLTHNGGSGIYDAWTRDYYAATLACQGSNSWGNTGANWRAVNPALSPTCFSYNPLYADAAARRYEPTVHSPNRGLGQGGQHVGALPHQGAAGPQLMGYLWENTTFTAQGSPYSILGDLIVPANVTVTFQPGALLRVAPATDGMGGGVVADLTEIRFLNGSRGLFTGGGAPITIRPDSPAPTPGMWAGLRFDNGGTSV